MAYELIGSCSSCGDCCACHMVTPLCIKGRKNWIGIDRGSGMEYMLYCNFIRLEDGKFVCKFLEVMETECGILDLTKPLDSKLVTEQMRSNIISTVDGEVMTTEQVELCCQVADFPHGLDPEYLAQPSKHDPSVNNLQYMCPNCTKSVVEV